MVKVEHNIDKEANVVALAFSAQTLADIETLDVVANVFMTQPNCKVGYTTSTKLVVHVTGLDLSESQ